MRAHRIRTASLLGIAALFVLSIGAGSAEAAILKRVHSGTETLIVGNSPRTVTLELPDASKAFVMCRNRSLASNSNSRVTCVLSDNTLVIDAGSPVASSAAVAVSYYVAEFESGVTVQRNTAAFGSSDISVPVTLSSAVDCSESFVVMAGEQTDAANSATNDEQFTFVGILGTTASPCGVSAGTTTSTLTISRLESGNAATVAWQVVTMDGAAVVARGTTTITKNQTTATAAITSTDSSRAFLMFSRQAGTATNGIEAMYMVRGDFTSGCTTACTGVTFTRELQNNTNNTQMEIAYEVVRLDDGATVQRATTTSSGTTSTAGAANNITAVDRSATVPIFSASIGGTSTSTVLLDDGTWTVALPSTTQLQFTRAASFSTVGTINWFAVSFQKCVNSRLCNVSVKTAGTSATVSWSPIYDPQCVVSGSSPLKPTACEAVVVRDTASISASLTNGTSYAQNATVGSTGKVVYNGTGTSFTDTCCGSLTAGTQYYYRVYPKVNGATTYMNDIATSISQVSVTPNSSANVAWIYATSGGATLNAPIAGNGRVYVASNGGKMITLNSSTGAEVATPVTTNGALQASLVWLPLSDGTSEAVIGADQKGWLTSIDGVTGARNWSMQMPVDNIGSGTTGFVQAEISAQLRTYTSPPFQCDSNAFENAYGSFTADLIYAASRNNSRTTNQVFAVRADTGAVVWKFPGLAGSPAMDRAAGAPYIDYCRNRLWVSTGNNASQNSLWAIDTTTGTEVPTTISGVGDQTNAAPSLAFDSNTVWVGDGGGRLYAVDASAGTPAVKYSVQLGGTTPTITGFVWEDWTTAGRLYVPVTVGGSGGVWCVEDNGSALTACSDWATNPRLVTTGAASQPLVAGTAIFFPGADGKIYQINTTDGALYQGTGRPFTVESGTALGGLSTEDLTQLYVGTSNGRSYRINLSSGNLP